MGEPDAAAFIRCYDLTLAVDGWAASPDDATPSPRHEAAQGLVLALLRRVEPERARELHDANQRKALSIGPALIRPHAGNTARAALRVGVWDRSLATLLDAAFREETGRGLHLGDHPALLLDWNVSAAWTVEQLLDSPSSPTVRVRFVSPTLFGFGRHASGAARYHLLPDPGLVVASWLRAWKLTGDRSLDWLPASPEGLGEAIALIETRDVRTAVVAERTARLTGFLGECAYRWEGREREGRRALTTLARFAGVCGSGAKTGRGFGQTRCLLPSVEGSR